MQRLKKQLQIQRNNYIKIISQKPRVIFKQDPKAQKQLQEMKALNREQLKELKELKNPQKMKQAKEKQMDQYIKYIGQRTKKWSQEFDNVLGLKNHVIVGNISTGKSSTLNFFYDLKLETGVSETTLTATLVHKHENICIWDSPGFNEQFDLIILETLKLFANAHKIFYAFDASLKNNKNDLLILSALKEKKDIFIIRTKCDNFTSDAQRQKDFIKDQQILESWGLKQIPVLFASNKNGDKKAFDNEKIYQLLSN